MSEISGGEGGGRLLNSQCRETKANGERCRGTAKDPNSPYCWAHDPANAERRQRTASKAAKSEPSREIKDLKKQLEELASDVLAGRVERGDAVAVNQILNTRLRALEVERKIREQDELEARLEQLERAQESGRGGRRWGA
jgi:hypothetical protein